MTWKGWQGEKGQQGKYDVERVARKDSVERMVPRYPSKLLSPYKLIRKSFLFSP